MMEGFELSKAVNANNVFLVNHSELEGRLDIDCYRPEINKLEHKVRAKTTKKLSDFIIKMASGATPSVQEEVRFYGDIENGIPFLRVQNLNHNGKLSLNEVKFINHETHNNYLKRSQVSEHDLLVKITGVGRMAIASVAPIGFVGNTNQHMVVIKTKSEEQSRYLANYLNLDIIEALASRRATGATRPALDYPALKSIPIIEHIDFSLLKQAEQQKQQKEQQAQTLLDGIDSYLLNELGITLPQQDNRLEKRMFTVPFNQISGKRIDPYAQQEYFGFFKTPKSIYKLQNIKKISSEIKTGLPVRKDFRTTSGLYPYYGANGIIGYMDEFTHDGKYLVVGQDGYIGNHYVVEGKFWGSNHNWVIKLKNDYSYEYLKAALDAFKYDYLITGAVIPKLTKESLESIKIPLPPIEKQNEIAAHISQIRAQAKQLQADASRMLADAKAEIERMILGENG